MKDPIEDIFENIRRDLIAIKDKISQLKQDVRNNQESNNTNNNLGNISQTSSKTEREDNEKFGVVVDRQISGGLK